METNSSGTSCSTKSRVMTAMDVPHCMPLGALAHRPGHSCCSGTFLRAHGIGPNVALLGTMRAQPTGMTPKPKQISVAFINMAPVEELVAAVQRVAKLYALRRVASRIERLATGFYRARVQARGRAGICAHRDPYLALLGALTQLVIHRKGMTSPLS